MDWNYGRLSKYDGIGLTVNKYGQDDSASLLSSYVNCIYEDKNNNLWIGVVNGLCKYNRDKNIFERMESLDTVVQYSITMCMRSLWITTRDFRWEPKMVF